MTDVNNEYWERICIRCGEKHGNHYGNHAYCNPPSDRIKFDDNSKFTSGEKINPINSELDDLFDDTIKDICGEKKEEEKPKKVVVKGGWSIDKYGDVDGFSDEEIWKV